MDTPTLRIIGTLHGDIVNTDDAPKNFDESNRRGSLHIDPQYVDALDGIETGQTIVVLF